MERTVTNQYEYQKALLEASKMGFKFAKTQRIANGVLKIIFVPSKAMLEAQEAFSN